MASKRRAWLRGGGQKKPGREARLFLRQAVAQKS
jgi:hypothetical protein